MQKTLLVLLCVLAPAYYAWPEPIEVEVELERKEFLLFEFFGFSVRVKNNSRGNIALMARCLPERYGERAFRFGADRSRHEMFANIVSVRGDLFFVLPPGKYVTKLYFAWLDSYIVWEKESYSLFVTLQHKIPKDFMEKYECFAREKDADIWQGKVISNSVPVKFVSPRNTDEWRLRDLWESTPRTDNVIPYPHELCRGREKELMDKFPEHPILDYWFWHKNQFSDSWLPRDLYYTGRSTGEPEVPLATELEEHIATVDDMLHRRSGDSSFDALKEQLLWTKIASLYALGRDAEADTLKEEIMSKEPDRMFDFELRQLEENVEKLKRVLESEREPQQDEGEKSDLIPSELKEEGNSPAPKLDKTKENRGLSGSERARPAVVPPDGTTHRRTDTDNLPPDLTDSNSAWLTWLCIGAAGVVLALAITLLLRRSRP